MLYYINFIVLSLQKSMDNDSLTIISYFGKLTDHLLNNTVYFL